MTGKITHMLPETVFESLDTPPHVLSQLTAMFLENWHPTHAERETLLPHLVECLSCQLSLTMLIALELESDLSREDSRTLQTLLAQLTDLFHETQTEDLATYMEVLEAQSHDEADSQFPLLSEHLKQCRDCQSTLEETQALLHRAEQAGLIAPFAVRTSKAELDERDYPFS